MKHITIRNILFFMLFFITKANAQKKPGLTVSGDFKNATIRQFAEQIEEKTDVHFFYSANDFDSLRITFEAYNMQIAELLDSVFSNTDFHYFISRHNEVFLTRSVEIHTDLLFSEDSVKINLTHVNSNVYTDKNPYDPSQHATLENKLFVIGLSSVTNQRRALVSGYIKDDQSGEPIKGASVYIDNPRIGVSTDNYGFYTISLPKGRRILNIQSIGMKDTHRHIQLNNDGTLNIDMQSQVMVLKNVIVSAEKISNIRSVQMGVQSLDIKTLKQVPVVFGETDVLRVLLLLPGVKSVGESSTGLNVRGGSADQNLILFNDATIYNPAHFFGFFSAFNPDVVKGVELYKSSMPARYGGRLSSVIDITGKEGNKKEFSGSAGIGPITSRLEFEGPLVKDKTSFILGARTTYADWILKNLQSEYRSSEASFYDLNLGISHSFNKNNSFYLTAYTSKDRFKLNTDTSYGYGNLNLSLKWKHNFSEKLTALFIVGYDRYNYFTESNSPPENAYKFAFDINQYNVKAVFNYFVSSKHSLEFGFNSIYYNIHPGIFTPGGKSSLIVADTVSPQQALESAVFISDKYTITSSLVLEAGLRYSLYNDLGPANVNIYAPGIPKTPDDIISVQSYQSGKVIQTYGGPEYRLSLRYSFSENFSLKASYNTERQYIHMLSNTAAISPTDIWQLSDPYIKPQLGDQFSIGLYKNLKNNTIEASVEVYYKNIKNYLDYKSGATLVLNHHIETDLINTIGKAYGVELLIKKATGKLNGWFSYTYSRILLRQDDAEAGELINNGSWYPASYDQPNTITAVGNYRVSHRFSVSVNSTYSTGRPITVPIGIFNYYNSFRAYYSDRNAYRIPDYFRTDFSLNIDGNHKIHQKFHNSWTVGAYNLFGRKNPYSVYYVTENGAVNGYKLSIFGTVIPFVNFNVKF
jgi:hypothetical protein